MKTILGKPKIGNEFEEPLSLSEKFRNYIFLAVSLQIGCKSSFLATLVSLHSTLVSHMLIAGSVGRQSLEV